MKKLVIALFVLSSLTVHGQKNGTQAFKAGEWLKFRIHYGIINASYACLLYTSPSPRD